MFDYFEKRKYVTVAIGTAKSVDRRSSYPYAPRNLPLEESSRYKHTYIF